MLLRQGISTTSNRMLFRFSSAQCHRSGASPDGAFGCLLPYRTRGDFVLFSLVRQAEKEAKMDEIFNLFLFDPGNLYITPGVQALMEQVPDFAEFVMSSLTRHIGGDWGDMCEEDKYLNNRALRMGGRLFSGYYHVPTGQKVWIITYPRQETTILLPEEY